MRAGTPRFAVMSEPNVSRGHAGRAAILDPCLALFETYARHVAPDGYPGVIGTVRGRRLALTLIPDSLAPKRLPQLWLSVALQRNGSTAPLVMTARPRGDDYVSLRSRAAGVLDVPAWLPDDFEIRGDRGAMATLAVDRPSLTASFADPAVKEIALVGRRLHMLYRLSEGRRGRHLLFREPVFDDVLTAEQLGGLVGTLERLDANAGGRCP